MQMHSVTVCENSAKASSLQNFSEDEYHPRKPKGRSTVNPVRFSYVLHSKAEYRSNTTVRETLNLHLNVLRVPQACLEKGR